MTFILNDIDLQMTLSTYLLTLWSEELTRKLILEYKHAAKIREL